ncbi:MAG: chromosome segregation protein SMC [Aquificae bacterium]|nr:chromosome segregation protein SMC [Aquificota bacterium]
MSPKAYIEKVVVEGFKSYGPKRREIPLGEGFVAVVGPNGSGKSNIGDAISFALGLASSKVLRAKNLSYLIWSKGNKRADHALVEVHFRNEGAFPVDEEVIVFSRKVFPNGRTVFKINGKTVKERDVRDLLTRAGITENAYNVVLQGDIIHFLKMTPLQRRKLIEEIAGIGEFDEKKEKALLELGEVELKLKELKLVLEELKKQLSTLEEDARKLRLYRELKEREKLLEAWLTLKLLEEVERKKTAVGERLALLDGELNRLETQKRRLSNLLAEVEGKLLEVEELLAPHRERTGKLEAQREFLERRLSELAKEVEKLRSRLEELPALRLRLEEKVKRAEARREELLNQKEELERRLEEERRKLAEVDGKISSLEGKLGDAAARLGRVEQELKKLRKERKEKEERLRALLRELDSLDAKVEKTEENLKELEEQKRELLASFVGKAAYEREKLEKLVEEKTKEVNALREKLQKLDERLEEVRRRREELLREVARLEAESAARENEVVAFLKRAVSGVYGTVAELIRVRDEEFLTAVEVAGGNRLRYVVVEDETVAKECIDLLKKHDLGRLTFIPLNRVRVPRVDFLPRTRGVIDFVYRLLDYDPAVEKAVLFVFGDTVLVEDYEAARRLGIGVYRMVTLEGELFEKGGTITGGRFKPSDLLKGSMVRQKLAELRSELEELQRKEQKLKKDYERTKEKLWSEEGALNYAKRKLKELEEGHASAAQRLKRIEEKIQKGLEYLEYLKQQVKEKEAEVDRLQEELTLLEERETELARQKENLLELISQSGLEDLRRERERVLADFEKLRSQLSELERLLTAVERELEDLGREEEELTRLGQRLEAELLKKEEEEKELLRKLEELKAEFHRLGERISALLAEREKLRGELENLRRELALLEAKIDKVKSEREKLVAELARLEQEEKTLKERLGEGIAEPPPQKGLSELRRELKKVGEELKRLGSVNFRAEEELEEVRKRYSEIDEKYKTLLREKRALTEFISEIESKKTKIFLETFEAINRNFKEIFSFLSPGGRAHMELEKPHDPLSGGINMFVKPRGKEVKYLEAMSGGEKTLAALSLIFALQRYRPAPFYYFDEVDAHLDEANAVRVGELIKKYSKEAQFIVVTLRESVAYLADRLVGVTSKGGISEVYLLDPSLLEAAG